MHTITVKIPEELDARLEAEAQARRLSKSEVVREALAAALGRKERPPRSAYAAMKKACGVVKEGPPDLSTGKKHLRGYGK